MPTYEISAPDGNKYRIEGPEGATQDQVIQEVLRQNPFAGQTTEELKKAPSAPSTLRDINETAAMSLAGGLKSLTDLFGANNAVSRNLAEKQETALKQMTPARIRELQIEEELAKRAEGKTGEEISTAARAFARSPLQGLVGGAFSTIPVVAATALAPEVALPAGIARLLGTGVAGKVGQKIAGASPGITVGAGMGVGSQKGQDYQAVKDAMLERGATEEEAEAAAQKAAEYSRENAPRQAASGIAGGAEAALGVESVLGRMGRAGKAPATAPTRIGTAVKSTVGEAVPEAIQSITGGVGTNIALQQAGFDRDLMAGVAGQATTEALTGALLGTAVSPLQYKSLQMDFLRQKQEEANKKQEEFEKQRQEFAEKYQKQQEETKKNLGLNMLALPAPAPKAEDKYRNPAANITKQEMGSEAAKYVDDYRKANNLPELKAYSIEDIKDAMPGLNPEGEKGILDSILAGKYGYKPVDETTGNEIKYTSDDILSLAEEEKNIATGTQGFKDFLTSVTGTDNVGEMSQPQLHAAYSALQNFEPSEETRILPQGTAATRFSEKQYDQALKWVGITFGEFDNKPLDPDEIVKDIKDATGLENDRDARALLDSAVKNGDLTLTTKPVFRVVDPATGQFVHTAATRAKAEKYAEGKDLNIIGDSQSYISPAEQETPSERTPLPAGYQIKQERTVEGEEDLVDVMREGKGQPLETVAVNKAQERVDTLTGESKALADKSLKRIEADSATVGRIQQGLDQRVAKGEGNTSDFKIQKTRSESAITNLRKRIQKNLDKIEELSAPIKTRKSEVKKPIIKKKLTVTKDGKVIGTFPKSEQAQDAILTQMTDEEIQAVIDDKKLGLFGKKAKAEQDRRRGPTGFKIKKSKTPETLSPEFVDQADEIRKKLVPMLQKFGLGNVGLNIVNAIKNNAEGSYLNNLIQVAIDATNPVQTMRHEALHALKDLGFFTESQWQALTNKANTEWIQKYLKNQNVEYEGQTISRYDAYKKMGLSDEDITEEAIADAFGDFDANGSPPGMIAALLKRLNNFFEALKNAIKGAGFQSAEDIFGKIERGELKGEKIGETRPTEPTQRPSAGGDEREKLSARRAGERRGRLPDGGPAPLEGAPAIEGATGPDPRLVEVAKAYAKKAGIPFRTQANYSYVYPQKASRIAKAYDEMGHAPNDPKVKKAYQELIDQTKAQYDALTDAGYKFTFFDSNTDPYGGNPFNAMRDLRKNKKMAVYGTYDGFGTEGITAGAVDDNPLLQDTGLRWPDQKGEMHPVTANDLFRAVHDAFGHGLEGAGFRARGEENAWQAHSKMYTGLARGAMTSETRGQNSWLNFGPYGDKNRNAKIEDTVFAQQKTGLMPEWTWNEGMVSDEEGVTLGKLQPQAQVYDAVHYGKQPSLNALNGDRYGEGIRGGERRRLEMSDDPRIKKRAYFYIENDKGEMPEPESGLGANVYTQRFNNILGPGPAMSEISRASRGDSNTFESEVIDAGYDGYAIPSMGMMVILNHNPPVNYQGTRPELQEKLSLKIVRDNEPVNLGEKPTVNAIGKYFDKSVMDAFGRKLSYQNGEDFERAFKQASEEVKYQLEQERSGLDWYDNDVKSAFKETAKLIPELRKSENRILFSVIAGIMSPQTNARDNWFIAAKNFQNYLATGDISGLNPETGGLWQGGTQSANKKVQLEFLDAMIKDKNMGKKKALAWVMSDHPVSEINSFRQKYGKLKSGIAGKMTDMMPGLYAFGPKVGPFVSNLNGIHDVTVDKWMTRTFNRYFGTMIGPDGNIIDAPTEPQRRAIKRLVNEVAQNANIKPYQVQSLLWFYEQKLFTKLGVPSPSYEFSDGARKFTQDARDRGGEEGVAGAVETAGKLSLRKAPDTPAFKRWFGDSKVVDANGEPLVVYHATKNFEGNEFKPSPKVNRVGNPDGYYFTHDIEDANRYAGETEGAQIIPVYLSIKNPFNYSGKLSPSKRMIDQYEKELRQDNPNLKDDWINAKLDIFKDGYWPNISFPTDAMTRVIKAGGYDGMKDGRDWVAFDSSQIKSATGNIGTYSESPDIRLSLRSTRQPPESKEFKQWFGNSYFTSGGEPLIMYHGTARDITIFKGKQAKAIFVTTKPEVAEDYANMGVDYMRTEAYKALTRDEKVELITVVAEQAERDGTITKAELKEIQSNLKKRVPPIDPEKNRILDLPYQIEGEIIESLNNLLPTKGNIMPVYVNARNIFDYANKDHVNKVYDWMMNNSRALGRMQNPEQWLKKVKDLISRGNWPRIESEDVQEAIRALDFDGFSVLEAGSKNYAVYNATNIKSVTGNIGTFGLGEITTAQAKQFGMTADQARQAQAEGDIRFSLKSQVSPKIVASIEKTTTVREEKGFAERMMDAISPKGFSSWRAEAVNRYNALSVADKIKVQKRGGAKLYADQSAEAAALMSDNAAGVAASAMGVHDRRGGIPVFKNGVTTIDGSVEGIVSIFAPLAKYKDPFVYQMYQFYSGAKRARRYLDKGIEKNYDANDIAYAEQLGKDYPEFKQIFEKWDKYNKGLVKYQVDTGVLSPAEGAEYIKYADYVPFYRQLEGEKTFGPNVFQSISGVKKPKKYTGGEAPIADFMETIVRNTQSAIQAGMKNTAAKMAVDTFVEIDQAELAPDGSTGEEFVHVLEGGVKKSYLVYDKALVQSVMSLNLPELPFIGFFAGPANLLRNLVTKDPGFMLANMVRDSMSAWVTSGVKMTPVASAIKNFTGALAGTAPEYQALLNAGILGGYDYSQGVEVSAASMKKALGKYAPSTGLDKLKNAPTSLWESLEKGTMASDAATRMEVYKNVLSETGNEAEALYRAMEVMNFNRKGRSAVVRVLTAAVPFLNARIQGLDVLYRAMSGQMGTSDAKKIQKAFFVRGASIMAMSMIYWALTHDEEEYKKQEQETRDNYWLIPSMGIKIPIPFEVGVIFKVIPERIAEYFFGNDTGKDFADSMKRNFMNTFAFNLIPQTVLPIYEAKTNYSFFTQRNIIGAGLEGVAPEYQVGPNTSQLAAFLGKELGYSPMLIDHVIGGYTGTFGSYAVDVIDSIAFANSDVQRPSKRFEQLPIFKRFLLDPQAKGNVTAYYDLKNSVDEAVRTSNFLEKTSNLEEMGKYNEETLRVLASKDFISDMEKDMKDYREFATYVRTSTMSPDDKRDMLRSITDAENAMTANIRYLRKLMD